MIVELQIEDIMALRCDCTDHDGGHPIHRKMGEGLLEILHRGKSVFDRFLSQNVQ